MLPMCPVFTLEIMARPKGLVKVSRFKDVTCPTMHKLSIECSSEFDALSNLTCGAIFANSKGLAFDSFCSNFSQKIRFSRRQIS